MASAQPFTESEMNLLDEVKAAKTGTAEDQFIQECTELVREWLKTRKQRDEPAAPDTQAILFVFSEAPDIEFGFDQSVVEAPRKIRKKLGTLCEGIVVCNQNFKVMRKVKECLSIEDAFDFAEENLTSALCFTIAKVGQFKLLIHRGGQELDAWLDDPEEIVINVDEIMISPDRIADDMKRFHHVYLSTPRARAARNIWSSNGEVYHLGEKPEQQVQSYLLAHFDGLYGRSSVFVHEEVPNQGGRTDISIERAGNGVSGKTNTVVELKILTPVKSFDSNHEWARSGILQANNYKNYDTDVAFACVFDARAEKLDMPELPLYATENEVRLELYDMEVPVGKFKKPSSRKKSAKSDAS